MLNLILFPFKLVWEIICFVFDIVSGALGLVFGLAGGIISLLVHLGMLIAGVVLVVAVISHFRSKPRKPEDEDFISYYDKDAVK